MAELVLLGGNLNGQALAQVARAHSGGIEMLHQIDAAPNQIERRGQVRRLVRDVAVAGRRVLGRRAECRGQLFLARRQIPVLVQIADDELGRIVQVAIEAQSSQLPRQVIGQSRGLGEKVFKRGLFAVFVLRLRAIAGVEIILEVRAEIDLVEKSLGRGGRFLDAAGRILGAALEPFFAARHLVQHRNRLVNLLQDGILHHLGIDHLLQFQLIEGKNAHHLHQARRKDLALRHFQIQSWLQQRHKWGSFTF